VNDQNSQQPDTPSWPHSESDERLRRWRHEPATMPPPAAALFDKAGARQYRTGGSPIIRFNNVSKAFDTLRVLNHVSLDILRGQTTVIIGPSGTGKSVLLKHIVGLLHPDRGEVFYENDRVDHMTEKQLVELRKKIGFLFQMGALFDSLNVGQNVEFPLVEHTKLPKEERTIRTDRVLRMVGLSGLQDQMPASLSGGQRKRVALARAIILEPTVVLYDEPTTGLDPIRSDLINELIIGLSHRLGITSVVVTHDMASACKIADRILLLYHGNFIFDGDPTEVRQSDNELVKRFIEGQADHVDLEMVHQGLNDTNNNRS
jgi:phospholipid/cholesterol/gamma-HCH transport system ATP-binding protein